jgi:hypothetical protein
MQQRTRSNSEQSLGSSSEELLKLIKKHLKVLVGTHNFTAVVPEGVLDDHVSLGTMISEVSCSPQKNANLKQEIVSFTIASIKWKLEQSEMV